MLIDPAFDFGAIELLCDPSCILEGDISNHDCIMEISDAIDFPDACQVPAKESQGIEECKLAHDMNNDDFKSHDQIKAPANCFLLYRSQVLKDITAKYPGYSSRSITSIVAENWKNEPESVKNHFKGMAAKEKAQFKKRFPEYRRIIKPKIRKRSDSFRGLPSCEFNQGLNSDLKENSDIFRSLNSAGRKRSHSMPAIPDYIMDDFQKRSLLSGSNSKLGPLLPLENLNSCKKSYLAEAFGRLV